MQRPATRHVVSSQQTAKKSALNGLLPRVLQPVWILVAIVSLMLFAESVAPRYGQLLLAARRYERVLTDLHIAPTSYAFYLTALDIILILAHVAIALAIFWRARESAMAVFVALTLVVTPLAAMDALQAGSTVQSWAGGLIRSLGLAASISLLYLFPDGRFIPSWTRALALLWALVNLPPAILPITPLSFTAWPRQVQLIALVLWSISGIYAQVYRYFRVSTSEERQQTRWAILGLTAAVLGPFGYYSSVLTLPSVSQSDTSAIFYNLADPNLFRFALLSQIAGVTIYALALLIFPLSLAIAVLRYHLFDIRIVVNRTLLYTGLTAMVVASYILIVGALGNLLQTQDNAMLAILATGFIAVLFNPLRQRLQQLINRLTYGEWDDPGAMLDRLGSQMERTSLPEEMLPAMVEAVAQALRLPYVALSDAAKDHKEDGGDVIAACGQPVARAASFPLLYQGEHVGYLLAAPRAGSEIFLAPEQRVLETVARQASAAVHAYRLTEQLRRSRERLITAREEERRRLRRDLHDGLGPQLATLTLKVDAARNHLHKEPQTTDALLVDLKVQIQQALHDVRRLAYALRPPALDQLGLVSALVEYASQHSAHGLHIHIEANEPLASLPAAVEVAVYRIALEAITNVARHARASRCTVTLWMDERLYLTIEDDGVGLASGTPPGVGLASMRERAEELGGAFTLQSMPGRGVVVRVQLPVTR